MPVLSLVNNPYFTVPNARLALTRLASELDSVYTRMTFDYAVLRN